MGLDAGVMRATAELGGDEEALCAAEAVLRAQEELCVENKGSKVFRWQTTDGPTGGQDIGRERRIAIWSRITSMDSQRIHAFVT